MRLLHKLYPSRKLGGSILSTLYGAITKHPQLSTGLLKALHGLVGASALAGSAYGVHKLISRKNKKQKEGDGLLRPGRPRADIRQFSNPILRSQMMGKISQEGTERTPHIYPQMNFVDLGDILTHHENLGTQSRTLGPISPNQHMRKVSSGMFEKLKELKI